ncbi:MAG: energy-coupling factor ABC transporter ATP-binding protein [Thermoplasmata archaeon]
MIRLEDVSFSYEKGRLAVKNISLGVEEGERVAILGPNGAGKSTILKLVAGLISPDSGRILMSGKELTRGNAQELRRGIGFLFQEPDDQIFMPSVREDVAFGPYNLGLAVEEVSERVSEAMKLTGIEDFGDRVPHKMSTGEKKRVAIAGILAMRPRILLLDEPCSSLDGKTRKRLMDLVNSLNVTLLVATQDVEVVVELADRVILLNRRKIADGSKRETFSSTDVMSDAGLELPEVSKLFLFLRDEGFQVVRLPLTAEEGKRCLREILGDGWERSGMAQMNNGSSNRIA